MQRISVDLPEPDGPHSTIFSPAATSRLTPLRAWKLPYHLSMPSMRIMEVASVAAVAGEFTVASMGSPRYRPSRSVDRERNTLERRRELGRGCGAHPLLVHRREVA